LVQFIIRKAFYGVLVLAGVIVVVFFLFNVLPGDPARMMLGQHADKESLEILNRDLGLDRPLAVQFVMYVNDLLPVSVHNAEDSESFLFLDAAKYDAIRLFSIWGGKQVVLKMPYLRRSYQSRQKVSELIIETLPETFILATAAILIALFFGIIMGVVAAIRRDTWIDNTALIVSALGMSGPAFFIGIILAWVGGYLLSEYTGLNMTGSLFTTDDYGRGEYLDLKNLVLPAITLGIRPLAIVVQLTRSSMIEVLSHDYIRTAKAKGLPFYAVVVRHALRNALNPVLTASSGWFAGLMAGAVFVEYVFGWKGIGNEIVDALNFQDFPVVMGAVLVITTIFVIINIGVDILYGILDPRVRLD